MEVIIHGQAVNSNLWNESGGSVESEMVDFRAITIYNTITVAEI